MYNSDLSAVLVNTPSNCTDFQNRHNPWRTASKNDEVLYRGSNNSMFSRCLHNPVLSCRARDITGHRISFKVYSKEKQRAKHIYLTEFLIYLPLNFSAP